MIMSEPIIVCPSCSYEIPLTASLAAPLLEKARQSFQKQLSEKEAVFAERKAELQRQQDALAMARETMEEQIALRIGLEREQIVKTEAEKARETAASERAFMAKEAEELRTILANNNEKLAVAQNAQAELLRKQRELDDARRELDLTIEQRVQASLSDLRTRARTEIEEAFKLKLSDRDQQLAAMTRTIEDLKRKAEQGSQQSQGEVLEIELEELLRSKFPMDLIEPVAKGDLGADIVQRVNGVTGAPAGVILWESKRTKNWSDGWLPKLREDQRRSNADIALIVSQTLPKHIDTFDLLDGVWITHPRCAVPVAIALRQGLIELAGARLLQHGQQTKTEQVYEYLTGTKFRQRVEAIIEKFNDLREDLDKERKFMVKQWAKRDAQIVSVIESTAGMYGDLQGIAGRAMPEITALDLPLLDGPLRTGTKS
jgi:hypothetical protein